MGKPYHLLTYNRQEGRNVTVIAHRGASAYYPDNTLISIEGAIEMEADMAEIDVLLTRDGVPVVIHNERLSRLSGGHGRVAHYTLQELKKLDFGYSKKGFTGEQIPTLDEVLSLCKNTIALNIEIKPGAVQELVNGGVEEKCVELVYYHDMEKHVVFSGFDPRVFLNLHIIDPDIATAVLYDGRYYPENLKPSQIAEHLRVDAFNCSTRELSAEWMDDLKGADIPVNVYTVNSEKAMDRFLDMGVSGLFTNRPDMLLRVLRRRKVPAFIERFYQVT